MTLHLEYYTFEQFIARFSNLHNKKTMLSLRLSLQKGATLANILFLFLFFIVLVCIALCSVLVR